MTKALKELIEAKVEKERIKELLLRLLRIPTPQTDLYEKEPKVLDFIREVVKPELEDMGYGPIVIDPMGNLICRMGEKRVEGKRILFVSYAMNAAPGSMPDPYAGKIIDGAPYGAQGECAWGRGASEQKGGLAAMLSALRIMSELDLKPPGELIFVTCTSGETGRHDAIAQVIEGDGVRADWGVVTGPPIIQIGNKGRIDVTITVHGRAAHSSRPWEGINAIEGALEVLQRLRRIMPHPSDKIHPELGRVTLTTTRIESFPKATHTIQDRCVIVLDRRLLPGDDPDEAFQQIVEVVGQVEGFKIEVEKGAFMHPSEVPKDAALVKAMGDAIRTMLGKEPSYGYAHQTIDSGYLNRVGITTVNYGPYDFRFAHTDHDIVEVERVVEATKVYAYLALQGGVGY